MLAHPLCAVAKAVPRVAGFNFYPCIRHYFQVVAGALAVHAGIAF